LTEKKVKSEKFSLPSISVLPSTHSFQSIPLNSKKSKFELKFVLENLKSSGLKVKIKWELKREQERD